MNQIESMYVKLLMIENGKCEVLSLKILNKLRIDLFLLNINMCFKLMEICIYHFCIRQPVLCRETGNCMSCGDSHHLFGKTIPLHISIYRSGCFFPFSIKQDIFFNTSTWKPNEKVSPKYFIAEVVSSKLPEFDLLN